MKILSSEQLRACDQFTIEQGISSIDLMERAAGKVAAIIIDIIKPSEHVKNLPEFDVVYSVCVYCGPGNNGGDGYLIARRLMAIGFPVKAIRVGNEALSADCLTSHDLFKSAGGLVEDFGSHYVSQDFNVIVDAIFGTGLNRKLEGVFLEAVREINRFSDCLIFSVDMPSGLFSDEEMPEDADVVHAEYLFKFHAPVLSLLLPQNLKYFNELYIIDIGLKEPAGLSSNYFLTGRDYFSQVFLRRPRAAHKGIFGHSCIIAGSLEKGGAALMAGKACLRSGTGLLTMCIPRSLLMSVNTVLPEAMVQISEDENCIKGNFKYEGFSAIGFGPGTGTSPETTSVLKQIIQDVNIPLVIDADGLNILAENPTWLAFLKPFTILTPHPGEFYRLSGEKRVGINQIRKASEMAVRFNIILVLKGAHTAVCLPDGSVHFNATGNSGMSRGGSGDVLTGIITSLLAQRYHPFDAARLGVFIHGQAGDFSARKYSEHSMRVTDLSESIIDVFNFYFSYEHRESIHYWA